MTRRFSMIGSVVGSLFVATSIPGQQSDAPPPEMKILQTMVGDWQEEAEPRTTQVRAILKGRFVESKSFGKDGELLGMHLFTYDTGKRAYRQWYFDANGATVESAGKWDEESKTLTLTNQLHEITGVMTLRFIDQDHMQWSVVSKDKNGKTLMDIGGKTTRRK